MTKPTTGYYYYGQMCFEEDYTYDNGGTPGLGGYCPVNSRPIRMCAHAFLDALVTP